MGLSETFLGFTNLFFPEEFFWSGAFLCEFIASLLYFFGSRVFFL